MSRDGKRARTLDFQSAPFMVPIMVPIRVFLRIHFCDIFFGGLGLQ